MSRDMRLSCYDCKETFEWSAGEQEFYKQKGFVPPKRCPKCRMKKKEREESGKL